MSQTQPPTSDRRLFIDQQRRRWDQWGRDLDWLEMPWWKRALGHIPPKRGDDRT